MTSVAKRIRRTPEEARRLILDAAQARLARTGPEGLRLQDIAADAGISHPSILHHFGSREGLVRALTQQAVEDLKQTLVSALTSSASASTEALLEQTFNAFRNGLAQRLAWLVTVDPEGSHGGHAQVLRQIVDVAHARRVANAPPGTHLPREDTEAQVHLVATAAFGDAMYGAQLRRSAGQEPSPAADQRFRAWLAALIQAPWGR